MIFKLMNIIFQNKFERNAFTEELQYFTEFQQIYIHIGLIKTMYLNRIHSRLVNFPALLGRQTFFEL